jgi:hypothetical protein
MRLRRAVPKIPAKSSVPLGSLLNKLRPISTRSESTLPQTLIPRDFISFRSNVYRKPGRVHPFRAQKFVDSLPAPARSCAHARTSATTVPSMLYFISSGHPGGGVSPGGTAKLFSIARASRDESWLSFLAASRGSRVTNRRPRNTGPLVPTYRCAATRKVPESLVLLLVLRRETYPLFPVSNVTRADIGSAIPERRPGRKSIPERRTRGSHSQEGLGPTF